VNRRSLIVRSFAVAAALLFAGAPLRAADNQPAPNAGNRTPVAVIRCTGLIGNLSAGGGLAASPNHQLFALMGWPALGLGEGGQYRVEAGLAFSSTAPVLTLDPPLIVAPNGGATLNGVARVSARPPVGSAIVTQMVFYADDVEIGRAIVTDGAGNWSIDWPTSAFCERNGVSLTARSRGANQAFSESSAPVTVNLRNRTFTDVPCPHWARMFIESLAVAGITSGFPDGTFRPDFSVNRAQMVVFLARSADLALHDLGAFTPPPCGQESFGDVPCTHWAYRFIEYAIAKGLVAGFDGPPNPGGGTSLIFRPGQVVTRQTMALFLARVRDFSDHDFAAFAPPACGNERFPDVPCSNPSYKAIEYLAAKSITAGFSNGLYGPGQPVTRAQMAVFLVRAARLPL